MPINPINNLSSIGSTQAPTGTQSILTVGAEYAGRILSFDTHGVAEVQIGDQVFGMKLPSNHAVGDVLHFRFLGNQPNPTFLLLNEGSLHGLYNNVVLSGAGMLIAQYLDEAKMQDGLSQIESLTPPLLQSPQNPSLTAAQLQNAIVMSGLFYESHLANFTKGKWPLNSLMREPQNRPNFNVSQVVNKQLDALENQAVRWAGTIWPGQEMVWQLGYDMEEPTKENTGEAINTIISEIQLDLARLGKVRISLRLTNHVLGVSMKAEKPQTEDLLKERVPALKSTFIDRGQELDAIEVVPHG
jgi:hypothetical protein